MKSDQPVHWAGRALVALSLLIGAVIFFPKPESTSPLIGVDERMYFSCIEVGCWNRVRNDISWSDLAARVGVDQTRLREGNPQVQSDTVRAGEMIRIRSDMKR